MNDRNDTLQWQRLSVLFDQAIALDAAGQAELLRTASSPAAFESALRWRRHGGT